MFFSITKIYFWLLTYRYLVLFPITIVEGPIITILAGFLSSLGFLNIFVAYALIVIGDLTGDILYYILGRLGGNQFISRWGRYFGVAEKEIEKLEANFDKHGGKLLLLGKISHGIGAAFLVAAGVVKMPFDRFFFFNLFATILKSACLILVGFYFGQAFVSINSYLEKAAVIIVGAVAIGAIVYLLYSRRQGNGNSVS